MALLKSMDLRAALEGYWLKGRTLDGALAQEVEVLRWVPPLLL